MTKLSQTKDCASAVSTASPKPDELVAELATKGSQGERAGREGE